MLEFQLFFLIIPPALVASGVWLAWFLHRNRVQETWERCAVVERRERVRHELSRVAQVLAQRVSPQLRSAEWDGLLVNRGTGFRGSGRRRLSPFISTAINTARSTQLDLDVPSTGPVVARKTCGSIYGKPHDSGIPSVDSASAITSVEWWLLQSTEQEHRCYRMKRSL